MPIYEYECPGGHRFEVWLPVSHHSDRAPCDICMRFSPRVMSVTGWSTGAVSTPSDFRDRRHESDYDRKLAGAFPMHYAIDKAGRGIKK